MTKEKLIVSSEWTQEERKLVRDRIQAGLDAIKRVEELSRPFTRYGILCVVPPDVLRMFTQMVQLVDSASSEFLEGNRQMYGDYVTT